jgi:hypothetical protein
MKKFFVAIMAVLFSAPSFAQYSSGGFSLSESSVYYGLRLGANFSTLTGDYQDLGTRVGMNLGGVVGLRVSDTTPVFLESGLYYASRGAKKDKESVTTHNLEVPILIKYGIQATDDIAVLPYIGPYFALGVGGNVKYEDEVNDVTVIAKKSTYDYYNHFDMGFKVGCGAEYNKLYMELGYQFGVTNLAKENPADLSAHNSSFYVNFGVNF